jgi:hypothetical protein
MVEVSDVTDDDSDKTWTVPAGQYWTLQSIATKLVTTGAGNRQMRIEIGDGTNLLWYKNFGAVQPASETRYYHAAPDLPNDADFDSDDRIRIEMEKHVLPAGFTLRVYDSAAIAATVDDMHVWIVVDKQAKPVSSV